MKISTEVGVASVHRARTAIARALAPARPATEEPSPEFPEWEERGGVFVTLATYPAHHLRGCVGFPRPILPRGKAIDSAAVAAAVEDPRFPPVESKELSRLTVEVSLLSVPESISAVDVEGRIASVVVGRDGLIVSAGASSGLLLPQVAAEEGWSALEFLEGTCEKAGLVGDAWRRPSTRIEKFEAAIFREVAPRGEVVPSAHGASPSPETRGSKRAASAR